MKKDSKKVLYESIMASVAREVKKALNEMETPMKSGKTIHNSELFHRIADLKKFGEVWISIEDPKDSYRTERFEDWNKRFFEACKKEGLTIRGGEKDEASSGIIYQCFYLEK